jgi:hypothetical protein
MILFCTQAAEHFKESAKNSEKIKLSYPKPEKIIIDALYFRTIAAEELNDIIATTNKKLIRSYAKLTQDTYVNKMVERLLL